MTRLRNVAYIKTCFSVRIMKLIIMPRKERKKTGQQRRESSITLLVSGKNYSYIAGQWEEQPMIRSGYHQYSAAPLINMMTSHCQGGAYLMTSSHPSLGPLSIGEMISATPIYSLDILVLIFQDTDTLQCFLADYFLVPHTIFGTFLLIKGFKMEKFNKVGDIYHHHIGYIFLPEQIS